MDTKLRIERNAERGLHRGGGEEGEEEAPELSEAQPQMIAFLLKTMGCAKGKGTRGRQQLHKVDMFMCSWMCIMHACMYVCMHACMRALHVLHGIACHQAVEQCDVE